MKTGLSLGRTTQHTIDAEFGFALKKPQHTVIIYALNSQHIVSKQ